MLVLGEKVLGTMLQRTKANSNRRPIHITPKI